MEQALSAAERAAAHWNLSDGVRRHGPAYGQFAAAVGHLTLIREPELFSRSLVGCWPSVDALVADYIEEAGLEASLTRLPDAIRPLATLDRQHVEQELRAELLVLDVGEQIYVFDAQPVVNLTVDETQHPAHSERPNPEDPSHG